MPLSACAFVLLLHTQRNHTNAVIPTLIIVSDSLQQMLCLRKVHEGREEAGEYLMGHKAGQTGRGTRPYENTCADEPAAGNALVASDCNLQRVSDTTVLL